MIFNSTITKSMKISFGYHTVFRVVNRAGTRIFMLYNYCTAKHSIMILVRARCLLFNTFIRQSRVFSETKKSFEIGCTNPITTTPCEQPGAQIARLKDMIFCNSLISSRRKPIKGVLWLQHPQSSLAN